MNSIDKKETAKERLIQAGIDTFAEHGFNGTTTRMIAKKADCNLAAIPYYFGGKKGLYLAVFEKISDVPATYLRPQIDAINAFLHGASNDPEKALIYLKEFLTIMVDLFCGHPKVAQYAQLIIREQWAPTSAFDIIYNKIIDKVLGTVSQLIAVITGENDDRKTTYQAFMMIGQILAFRNGREAIVRRLGLQGYSADETREIRDLVITWVGMALGPK